MSLCRQHQTHNQRRNLQPDKRTHTHTELTPRVCTNMAQKQPEKKMKSKGFRLTKTLLTEMEKIGTLAQKKTLLAERQHCIWEVSFGRQFSSFPICVMLTRILNFEKSSHKDPGACRCSVSEMNSHLQGQVNGEDGARADSCLYPPCAGSSLVTVCDQKSAVEVVNNDKIFNYGTGLGEEFKGRTAAKSWSAHTTPRVARLSSSLNYTEGMNSLLPWCFNDGGGECCLASKSSTGVRLSWKPATVKVVPHSFS